MRTTAPPLLPIFRSRLQGQLLALVLLQPEPSQSLTSLARTLKADVATMQREVTRLERAGILKSHRVGNTRLVTANTASPVYRPLAELALHAFGPAEVVGEEFAKLKNVDEIYIFGSWAARYEGVEGTPPHDVDVLIVGSPSRDQVYEAALRAERRLGREVNATIRSRTAWHAGRDSFVKQLHAAPLVPILRSGNREARAT